MAIRALRADFIVSANPGLYQDQASVTALANGGFAVAWHGYDAPATQNIHYRSFTFAGAPTNSVGTAGVDLGDELPDIIQLSNGSLAIIYQSGGVHQVDNAAVYGEIIRPDGTAGTPFRLNTRTALIQEDPEVTALSGGRFIATWVSADTGTAQIRSRVFNANGVSTQADVIISTGALKDAVPDVIGLSNGRMAVVWCSYTQTNPVGMADIKARILGPTGVPIGQEFLVAVDISYETSRIVALDGGGFAIAFAGQDFLMVRTYGADGAPMGPATRIAGLPGQIGEFDLAKLSDGTIAVAWSSPDPADGSMSCIRARQLNHIGQPMGPEIIVNNTTAGDQTDPDVAGLAGGRFVVTWTDYDEASGANVVRARTFGFDQFKLGSPNNDVFRGGAANDLYDGRAGNDVIIGGGGNDTLVGNVGADSIDGGPGNDLIMGGDGNDVLAGGTGIDRMIGGAGADRFSFKVAPFAFNADVISDFSARDDTILLDNAVFRALGARVGALLPAMFWSSVTGLAHDANDRVIYETDTGRLTYDSNGNAAGGVALIATLTNRPALTAADFVVI